MVTVALRILHDHISGDGGVADVGDQVGQGSAAAGDGLGHGMVEVFEIVFVVISVQIGAGVVIELVRRVGSLLDGDVEDIPAARKGKKER